MPLATLDQRQAELFTQGDSDFELPHRDGDGLGPLYIRTSCSACHREDLRGPGLVQKMVLVEADGVTPLADQSLLAFGHTVRPHVAAGAANPILPPADEPTLKLTTRLGPAVLGRGYMEAIRDDEIERVAAEQAERSDAIHGRVNHVVFASQANPDTAFHTHQSGDLVIGRFGLKARVATLDDFTADAFQGDMGLTTPLRPTELANPDGLTDDETVGVDVPIESVEAISMYLRALDIPTRADSGGAGPALFDEVRCAACHVPSMRTRADYPIAELADIDAPIFSDMLLHDLGDELADGMVEGEADSRSWRTAPLIGLRFMRTYMHDGRAKSLEEAILAHGGEATESVSLFEALAPGDRAALLEYVGSL
ncbi:MAG: di-heme oxidoredictase family protein [Polyangiaceae bacterium]